jgi:hypothetical protein
MVNEVKPGHHITDFVTVGAKNYAYQVLNQATGQCENVCKNRDITLNFSAKYLVNFDVINNMILNPREAHDTVNVHTDKKIKRKKGRFEGSPINIITEPEDKMYRMCYTKRLRLIENSLGPFGYIN